MDGLDIFSNQYCNFMDLEGYFLPKILERYFLPKTPERYFLPKNLRDPNLVDRVSDILHGG
jgi:hypothetical protein